MSWQAFVQLVLLTGALAVAAPLLGRYMAAVYSAGPDDAAPGERVFRPVERLVYRTMRVDPRREQRWNVYALSLIAFSMVSFVALYLMARLQGSLPFNPTDRDGVVPRGAFNAAVSFVTNTNWQWFSGEQAISHLTQMLGFTVQNFVSAAAGMAVAVALIRGITRSGTRNLGNFWVDLTRTVVRILIPLALVLTVVLLSQGVVQNLSGDTIATPLDASSQVVEQRIPGGPFASQEAIKELGTNGGGPYNANSSHPFESPNGFTTVLQIFSLLLIPLSLVFTFGRMVRDRRQAHVLVAVMAGLLLMFAAVSTFAEQSGNPLLTSLGVDQSTSGVQSGGNMEGKEVRFGAASCGMFAAATTGTSTGSVNCMHDSMTPIGGAAPMAQMMLGEISPGGVGVGLMGVLINALLAVFIAGLMVGRTPEYLGKKIQASEMKLMTLYILAMPFAVLTFAAASVVIASAATYQSGPHGLSEVLYNFASTGNNNGSAFAYQGTGTQWYTTTQGISMLMGRFLTIIPALAIGGSLAAKPKVPATSGTLPTHTPLFGALLAGVIFIVAGLTFFPALALGPILEHLSM
jgi:K+-transporting ATPase ATPase A chain